MTPENLNMDEINDARRAAIAESIRTVTPEELQKLIDQLFPYVDHPWREKLAAFVEENSGTTFHHATAGENINIIYCHAKGRGIWFLPDGATGLLQANGLKIMKEIVEKA